MAIVFSAIAAVQPNEQSISTAWCRQRVDPRTGIRRERRSRGSLGGDPSSNTPNLLVRPHARRRVSTVAINNALCAAR